MKPCRFILLALLLNPKFNDRKRKRSCQEMADNESVDLSIALHVIQSIIIKLYMGSPLGGAFIMIVGGSIPPDPTMCVIMILTQTLTLTLVLRLGLGLGFGHERI